MGTPTNYYVDPLNGDDTTGDGTIGTPWKSVQKALNTITRNTTDGDIVNLRDTAEDVLTGALDFTTYGTPTPAAPLAVRGYTNTAGDGGVGTINGNGNVILSGSTSRGDTYWVDLIFKNSAAPVFNTTTGSYYFFFRCKFLGGQAVRVLHGRYYGCSFLLDAVTGGVGSSSPNGGSLWCLDCYFKFASGGGGGTGMVSVYRGEMNIQRCVFNLTGGIGAAIRVEAQVDLSRVTHIIGNTIYGGNGGQSGRGIEFRNAFAGNIQVMNNLIAGFSSGVGIVLNHADDLIGILANNAYYNNGTDKNISTGTLFLDMGTDIVLASNPFTDAANEDFRVTDAVKALAFPSSFLNSNTNQYLDIGAAQREEAGGLALNPIGAGFIRGLV